MNNTDIKKVTFELSTKHDDAIVEWVFKGDGKLKGFYRKAIYSVSVFYKNKTTWFVTSMKVNISNSIYFIRNSK